MHGCIGAVSSIQVVTDNCITQNFDKRASIRSSSERSVRLLQHRVQAGIRKA